MKREEVLGAAATAVMIDRNADHGAPEDSFSLIAELWEAYLERPIDGYDVAAMMALLKIARIRNNPRHADSWIDLAGYAACGAEVAVPDAPRNGSQGWTEQPSAVVTRCKNCYYSAVAPNDCDVPEKCPTCMGELAFEPWPTPQ